VPSQECMELYIHSPIRLHGVVLSGETSTGLYLYLYLYEGPVING